ncbi:MAG: NfeD family protein [Deltaproteobacteria bacterium]|jgi:membrane protein implicated in regulation of membrane protease activity|nr:NfeD family protein [Deltaproteobacteria bacterium]
MSLFGNYWLFWFVIGFVFLFLEVLTPGVVFVFFGLGGWVVMVLVLIFPLPVYLQWVLFIVLSVIFLIVLRRKLNALFKKKETGRTDSLRDPMVANQYIGREVVVVKAISPEKAGLIELNGSNWQARSLESLPEGANAKIVELKDLIVWVELI